MLNFCAWCGKHITPFMFNKMYTTEITKKPFWFCSLRCYTEWNRRFYVKRNMLDLQFEGNPLENMPENLPMLQE
jgi:hypothetical protein